VARGHAVDPRLGRRLAAPLPLVPALSEDPGALGNRAGVALQDLDEIVAAGREKQVQGNFVGGRTEVEEMEMSVDQAGKKGGAAPVDDTRRRADPGRDLAVCPDRRRRRMPAQTNVRPILPGISG
jgi:hypothetical protein